MMNRSKNGKLVLIFTRDFSLFTCEFWRDQLLLKVLPAAWGKGLSEQIIIFKGRLIEAYRRRDEVEELQRYITTLPLNHHLFSSAFQVHFRKAAQNLRGLITAKKPLTADLLETILREWSAMYPGYMLAMFLPGAWADSFRKARGTPAEAILNAKLEDRLFVEGLFEQADFFLREKVAQMLEKNGLSPTLARLVRFAELQQFAAIGNLPAESVLEQRQLGYAIIQGKFFLTKTPFALLEQQGYQYNCLATEKIKVIKGTIAYSSKRIIEGTVRLILTKEDFPLFQPGEILVTPMTTPDFVYLMKKAAAIITDEGGITCHAAIASRELQKPCLIGTKIATKALKDGMKVKIDGDKVYILFPT